MSLCTADRAPDGLQCVLSLNADLSSIPASSIQTSTGKDGELYYKIAYAIQMTCYSAYTKYELIYKGVNYGPVIAEYV